MIALLVATLAWRRASTAHPPPSMAGHIDRAARAAPQHSRAARHIIVQARLAEDRRLTGL
jgi:hypothetical protein